MTVIKSSAVGRLILRRFFSAYACGLITDKYDQKDAFNNRFSGDRKSDFASTYIGCKWLISFNH